MLFQKPPITRRHLLHRFARTCLGVTAFNANPDLFAKEASSGRAKSVIYLYLRGGLSHVDTFDPKPGRSEMLGVRAINTSVPGIQISEWFPRMAKQMHHVTLVRSMTSTQGIHERGNYLAHTSYLQTPTISHPGLSTWVAKRLGSENPLLPANVLINGSPQHPGSGFMESDLAPLPIVDPSSGLQNSKLFANVSESDFARRTTLAKRLGSRFLETTPHRSAKAYQQIQEEAVALMRSRDLQVFDVSLESEKTQSAFGLHTFGKGCLLARRLVESGVRFIEVEDDQNWDTHNDQLVSMQRMTPSADQTMAALLDDLHQRGLLESTLVVMATEFGRTPKINEVTAGRGHHPAVFTWWLAGAGIRGGYVHGKSDEAGERVAENPVSMPDFNATVANVLGIDLKQIDHSPSGRPFTVADKGRPLLELFT